MGHSVTIKSADTTAEAVRAFEADCGKRGAIAVSSLRSSVLRAYCSLLLSAMRKGRLAVVYLLPALVLAQRHDKLAAFSAGVFIVLVAILVRAKTVPVHFDTLGKRKQRRRVREVR